tara:strand:- start:5611 stop:5841 length:231 start_codon:yes stop_codon:yes gene_type:complete
MLIEVAYMSRTFNKQFFEAIEEIESMGESYKRGHALKLLIDSGCSLEESSEILDDIESKWDAMIDNLIDQQREQED